MNMFRKNNLYKFIIIASAIFVFSLFIGGEYLHSTIHKHVNAHESATCQFSSVQKENFELFTIFTILFFLNFIFNNNQANQTPVLKNVYISYALRAPPAHISHI